MDGRAGDQARAAVEVLADLSSATSANRSSLSIPLEWFRWLPMCEHLFVPPAQVPSLSTVLGDLAGRDDGPSVAVEREFGEKLIGVDQVRAKAKTVRVGWLFVAGRLVDGDRRRRVFHPLVTVPVRIGRPPLTGSAFIVAAGDAELSPLITGDDRHRLEAGLQFGGGALADVRGIAAPDALLARLSKLRGFALEAAVAAGLPATRLVSAHGSADDQLERSELVVVAGYGVYVAEDTNDVSRSATLRTWAGTRLTTPTAFHAIYGLRAPEELDGRQSDDPVDGPLVLSPSQREAVLRSRTEAVTVISGAPGTGKSHTIAAIACDALVRGERVIVAAKSAATVDALTDLLERTPGPDPVVFGSNERRARLAARLASGQAAPTDRSAVSAARDERDRALVARDDARRAIVHQLDCELAWARAAEAHDEAWSVAPGLLDPDADLDTVGELLRRGSAPASGWWSRRRRRRAWAKLIRLARAEPTVQPLVLSRAAEIAQARASARQLDARGGLDLGGWWEALEPLDVAARLAVGEWLAIDARSPARINHATLGPVAALATALRSGRAARRVLLDRIDDDLLTKAFPLWIGTLNDIDDLLPRRLASFDLVLLDEASSIDQPTAATALLRARRAVIVGDPRQLRHVSFVGDDAINDSVTRHGLTGTAIAPRLDVRRNSVFDVAAGSASVTVLGEHYRCDPHLVDFVTRRLYDGSITIATRSPTTDYRDCVDAIRVDGRADGAGVIRAEVDYVLAALRRAHCQHIASVGVVTPFRAQADAIERAVLATFSTSELEAMDLRVGTVHAFQGNERDLVICSLGIDAAGPAASWRFAQDPHLLSVFLTRARRQLVFVYSCDPPPDGLLAAYLAQSDEPPGSALGAGAPGHWARRVTEHLLAAGFRLAVAYPTGRHILDAVLLDAAAPTALIQGVHPAGPGAHIDRHLALRRAGWRVEEAFESRWSDQLPELAIALRHHLNSKPPDAAASPRGE